MSELEDLIVSIVRRIVREEFAARDAIAKADTYLSPAEAADLASVSAHTIRRWIRDGKLAEHRVGPRVVRVLRSDLERLLVPSRRGPGSGGGELSPEDRAVLATMSPEELAEYDDSKLNDDDRRMIGRWRRRHEKKRKR